MGFLLKPLPYLLMEALKIAVYLHCSAILHQKAAAYAAQDQSLLASLDSEGKSSAGDKHETGRAMIQLEREKLAQQRQLNDSAYLALTALKNKVTTITIGPGSLVQTSLATYYLAVPADVFIQETTAVYCISPQSPLGQILLGKKQGDLIVFRDQKFEVLALC
jgi:hypothetical protein